MPIARLWTKRSTSSKEKLLFLDQSIARIGGKDNQWRSVDLQNLPKAAPIRDLFELIEAKQLSALPRQFWTMPKNRNHFEKQGKRYKLKRDCKSSPLDPDLSQLTVNKPYHS